MCVPWHYSPGACFIVQNICAVDGLTARNGCGILHTDSPLLRVSVLCSNSIVPRGGGRRQYTGFLAWRQAENPFVMPVSGHFIGAIFPARYYYSIKIRRGPLRGPHNAPRCVPVVGTFVSLPPVHAGGYSVGFGPQSNLAAGPAQRAGPVAPRRQRRRGMGCGGSRLSSRQCPQPCPRCGAGLACPASLNTSLAGVAVCGGHPEKLAPLYKGQFRYNWYLASVSASRNTLHAKPKRHARAGARARRRSGRRLVSDTRPGGAACERTFFGAVLRT